MDVPADEPPHIDGTLDPVRAAISLVADGIARSVTVSMPAPGTIMPAARQLARAASVQIELVGSDDAVVRGQRARGA